MAFLDDAEDKFIVRIVYDGPARAGKTTNLKALCDVFSTARRSELLSPEETAGRTTYFDWLQVDSGVVGGSGLRSIFLSVPGQRVLASRRFTLLELADVVTFVIDGSEPLDDALQMFRVLSVRLAESPERPALVVQVNKHDLGGSRTVDEVREVLELSSEVPVVPASARDGSGVRETAVLAMRAGANRAQTLLLQRGRTVLERIRYDAAALKEQIDASELGKTYAPVAALRNEPAIATSPPAGSPPAENSPTTSSTASDLSPASQRPQPPLPTADVASGCVWPASGRDILRQVDPGLAIVRRDLCSNNGKGDGSGGTDTVVVQAGRFCLKTSYRRSCRESETARAKLLSLARSKVMLGDLIPKDTVVSLQEDAEIGYFIWTTAPWLPTLRCLMQKAVDERDESALSDALSRYANASLLSAELAARSGIVLDVHPSNFALQGDRVVYVDDDVGVGTVMPTFGYSILRRVEEYAEHGTSVDKYLTAIEEGFVSSLNKEERTALDLTALIRDTLVKSEAAEKAKHRLVEAFSG